MSFLASAHDEVLAAQTFGRDAAMFHDLLRLMAQLSLGLWALVLATIVFRSIAIHLYRRRSRAARPGALAPVTTHVPDVTPSTDVPTPAELPVRVTAVNEVAQVNVVAPITMVTPRPPVVVLGGVTPAAALVSDGVEV